MRRNRTIPEPGAAFALRSRLQYSLQDHRPGQGHRRRPRPRQAPVIVCAKSSPRAAASPASSPSTRDATGNATPLPQLPQGHRRQPAPECSRLRSKRKPRPIYSANRLCFAGGVSALVKAGFETLVEAGYQPESALLRMPATSSSSSSI